MLIISDGYTKVFCRLNIYGFRTLHPRITSSGTELEGAFLHRLHEFRPNARRPAMHIPLTRQHVQNRLDFSRTHVRWTIRDWTQVLFTDVSRFCSEFTDRCQLEINELNVGESKYHYHRPSSKTLLNGLTFNAGLVSL